MPLDIIIFAAIAGFFVWKLRQVLGQKHGDERQQPNPFARPPEAPAKEESPADTIIDGEATEVRPRIELAPPVGSLASQVAQVKALDNAFDERQFLQGARSAFTFIVEAFGKGDTDTLKGLLKPGVYAGFEGEIERRKAAGETTHTTIQRLLAADISAVRTEGKTAVVTVDFTSEQLSWTKNAQGEVIDGNPNKAEHVAESWTFERDTTNRDPTWLLVATRTR